MKNQNVSAKKVNPATGAEAPKLTQHRISMHGAVITTEDYKKKISEMQKELTTGAKKKIKKRNKPTKRQKNQKKSFKQRL